MLPKSEIKDMSVLLEHVVFNGFRVRNREALWREFCNSGFSTRDDAAGTVERSGEHTSIHLADKKLYTAAFSDTEKANVKKKSTLGKSMGMFDEDDDLIPKEYLLPSNKNILSNKSNSSQSVSTKPILSRGSFQRLDELWEQEYGDGFDPMIFVEDCCSNNDGDETLADRQYTSRLLQRCWERAVHAVSSTVTVHVTDRQSNIATGVQCENRINPNIQSHKVTDSPHGQAMNVVDSVLDLLLSEKAGFIKETFEDKEGSSKQPVQWNHVLRLLQTTAKASEANLSVDGTKVQSVDDGDEPAVSNSSTPYRQSAYPTPLNKATLKAITMRVLERYGNVPY
jgi:hypothetical protein